MDDADVIAKKVKGENIRRMLVLLSERIEKICNILKRNSNLLNSLHACSELEKGYI